MDALVCTLSLDVAHKGAQGSIPHIVAYASLSKGSDGAGDMHLALSLPRVEAIDLRPWVPPEHALVISSEHTNSDGSHKDAEQAKNVAWPPPADSPAHLMKPSFLTLEFSALPRLAKQKVSAVVNLPSVQQKYPCL